MNPPGCFCSESDLLLASHRALPLPALLRVQLHRFTCPTCRERYRKLSQVSQQLAFAMTPHAPPSALPVPTPRLPVSLWGAALMCTLAIAFAALSANAYLILPDSRMRSNAPIRICESPKPFNK